MIHRHALIVITAIAFLLAPQPGASGPKYSSTPAKPLPLVSPIFGDNMVLQRGKVNTIWGWSEPGDKIRVEMAANMRPALRELTAAGR